MIVTLLAAAITLAGCSLTPAKKPVATKDRWVDAWQAAPVGPLPVGCAAPAVGGVFPNMQAVSQSVRMTVRPSVAGTAIRVRLSNRFGDRPLNITHVTAGITHDVVFAGARTVRIPAGDDVTSDPVDLRVGADRDLVISIAIESGGRLSWHVGGNARATAARRGDRTTEASGASYRSALNSTVVLTGIQVRARPVGVIVGLGDSLTDTAGAAPNQRWLDVLGRRLRTVGRPYAVVNAGIVCNTLANSSRDGGPKASERLDDDVLERAGVSHVIVFEGTNDIYGGVDALTVINALSVLAARIRDAGHRVIGATIIPKDGAAADLDAERQAVNEWIRTTKVYDGVIDFDAVIRSPGAPSRMIPAYRGDSIHPNVAGQIAMGNAINLTLFAPPS
jgi:lysophospholipase L1-like esterase